MSEQQVDSAETALGESVEATGMREFLGFVLGGESYALPLSSIREIMRVPKITEVPRAPRDVLGIVSVRGQVTTLIDLRRRLCMDERAVSARTRVLLVEHGREILGLLVDRVLQVHRLREDDVEMSAVLGSDSSSYIMGIGRPERGRSQRDRLLSGGGSDELLILLDPIALLKQYGGG